ncbi:unnamed protein product [Prorocentrum cordatum]|uniref:Tetratricopeptide repeat protein 38 n=1 Tax=Prorocentrum cordatum TaxID=2364126 RepID=A0ABN9PD40_9DINO|nr:unnamed protein product [Polarella glacialis]
MRLPLQNSHLQHMTSHTFFRTGFYHNGVEANKDAVDSDQQFLKHGKIPYGPGHNVVFLLSSALFAGERTTSYRYAQVAQQLFKDAPARPDGPNGRVAWSYPMIVAVRFGDWGRMVELDSLPPGNFSLQWPYGYGVVRTFALSIAAARLNRLDEAASNLRILQRLLPVVYATEGDLVVKASRIANYTAAAALAHARGFVKESLELFGAAVAVEMGMPYDEPPPWLLPTRECYGQAQLSAGQPAEAERTFRAALHGFSWHAEPNCGWALFGLRESLRAQRPTPNRTAEIGLLGEAIARARSHADSPLTSACSMIAGSGVVV